MSLKVLLARVVLLVRVSQVLLPKRGCLVVVLWSVLIKVFLGEASLEVIHLAEGLVGLGFTEVARMVSESTLLIRTLHHVLLS